MSSDNSTAVETELQRLFATPGWRTLVDVMGDAFKARECLSSPPTDRLANAVDLLHEPSREPGSNSSQNHATKQLELCDCLRRLIEVASNVQPPFEENVSSSGKGKGTALVEHDRGALVGTEDDSQGASLQPNDKHPMASSFGLSSSPAVNAPSDQFSKLSISVGIENGSEYAPGASVLPAQASTYMLPVSSHSGFSGASSPARNAPTPGSHASPGPLQNYGGFSGAVMHSSGSISAPVAYVSPNSGQNHDGLQSLNQNSGHPMVYFNPTSIHYPVTHGPGIGRGSAGQMAWQNPIGMQRSSLHPSAGLRYDGHGLPRVAESVDYVSGTSTQAQAEPDNEQKLYDTFKVRDKPKKFYRAGRVLMVLLTEPLGSDRESMLSNYTFRGAFGEKVHSKIRRFVVIARYERHSLAIPISSYNRRGVANQGVNKADHGIVYSGLSPPMPRSDELPRSNERPMVPTAIRVVMDDPTERLHPMSRIHYGKVHTIEHNVKASSVGMVHDHSMPSLQQQHREVLSREILES